MADDWAPSDDLFASFEPEPDNDIAVARAERIAAARKQAQSYHAKIEEPNVSPPPRCLPDSRT